MCSFLGRYLPFSSITVSSTSYVGRGIIVRILVIICVHEINEFKMRLEYMVASIGTWGYFCFTKWSSDRLHLVNPVSVREPVACRLLNYGINSASRISRHDVTIRSLIYVYTLLSRSITTRQSSGKKNACSTKRNKTKSTHHGLKDRYTDWLIEWLSDWLIGWCTGCLIWDRFTYWFLDWLTIYQLMITKMFES